MKNVVITMLLIVVAFQWYELRRTVALEATAIRIDFPLILGPQPEPIVRFTDNKEVCRPMHTPFKVNCLAFNDWSVQPNYALRACWPEANRKFIASHWPENN